MHALHLWVEGTGVSCEESCVVSDEVRGGLASVDHKL